MTLPLPPFVTMRYLTFVTPRIDLVGALAPAQYEKTPEQSLPAVKRQQPGPSIATWMMASALVRLCPQSGYGVEWLTAVPDDADAHVAKRNPL